MSHVCCQLCKQFNEIVPTHFKKNKLKDIVNSTKSFNK